MKQISVGKKMMATEDKKIKADLPPKNEASPDKTSTSGKDQPKAEGDNATATSPSSYSRGEGQKPVSKAYIDNWNAIFAKKKKR